MHSGPPAPTIPTAIGIRRRILSLDNAKKQLQIISSSGGTSAGDGGTAAGGGIGNGIPPLPPAAAALPAADGCEVGLSSSLFPNPSQISFMSNTQLQPLTQAHAVAWPLPSGGGGSALVTHHHSAPLQVIGFIGSQQQGAPFFNLPGAPFSQQQQGAPLFPQQQGAPHFQLGGGPVMMMTNSSFPHNATGQHILAINSFTTGATAVPGAAAVTGATTVAPGTGGGLVANSGARSEDLSQVRGSEPGQRI